MDEKILQLVYEQNQYKMTIVQLVMELIREKDKEKRKQLNNDIDILEKELYKINCRLSLLRWKKKLKEIEKEGS